MRERGWKMLMMDLKFFKREEKDVAKVLRILFLGKGLDSMRGKGWKMMNLKLFKNFYPTRQWLMVKTAWLNSLSLGTIST